MKQYLIFKTKELANIASKKIWQNMTKTLDVNNNVTNSYATAIELEDGNFAFQKPNDDFMEGIEYDKIKSDITFKQIQEL